VKEMENPDEFNEKRISNPDIEGNIRDFANIGNG